MDPPFMLCPDLYHEQLSKNTFLCTAIPKVYVVNRIFLNKPYYRQTCFVKKDCQCEIIFCFLPQIIALMGFQGLLQSDG